MLVGSEALVLEGYNLGRDSKDLDYILSWEDFNKLRYEYQILNNIRACYPLNDHKWVIKPKQGRIVEVEIAWEGSTGESLLELRKSLDLSMLDVCYTLKLSHRYLKDSPHFLKTMEDIHKLRELGATVPEELREWLKEREKETYHYQHPNLNRSKSEFFDTKGVTYKYDHDSIHEAVRIYERPAYTYFKPDDKEVFCDWKMFFDCSEDVRNAAVFEESCVLAIERSLVPFNNWDNEDWAFKKALEKVCTSITSGWFREYAWEVYYDVLKMKEHFGGNYLKYKFDSGIISGTITETEEKLSNDK